MLTRTLALPRAGIVALLLLACDDDQGRPCSPKIVGFGVDVVAPDDLVVDRVTMENLSLQECRHESGAPETIAGGGRYSCEGQAGGAYEIIVYAGDLTWTQTVDMESDGCHIQNSPEIEFDLVNDEPD